MNKYTSWVRQKIVCWVIKKGFHVNVHLSWERGERGCPRISWESILGRKNYCDVSLTSLLQHGHFHLLSVKREQSLSLHQMPPRGRKHVHLWLSDIRSSTSDWLSVSKLLNISSSWKKKKDINFLFPFLCNQ